MDKLLLLFITFILPFAIISIFQDIKLRKVKNIISLPFLFLSFLILVFFLPTFDFWDFFTIFMAFFLSYYLYKKDLWGGGDGKIFLALSFLIISYGFAISFIDYIINLIIFYSITIIILIIFLTSYKNKIKVIKEIDYGVNIFQLLIVFIFIKNLFLFVKTMDTVWQTFIFLMIFIGFKYIFVHLRNFYLNFEDENLQRILLVSLFVIMLLISAMHFELGFDINHMFKTLYYFILILIFKLFLEFISKMSELIKTTKKKDIYHSPFLVYLFLVAIFTLILEGNVIEIIMKLFF